MKTLRNLIILAACLAQFSFKPAGGKIEARILNLKNSKGVCRVCLYANAASYAGKGAPYRCLTLKIEDRNATGLFQDVPDGTYAVSVIHDENNNNKFDTNFIGIPKEGYGASRNKLPFAAAPGFDDNKFTVSGNNIQLNIRLRYL